MEAQCIGVTMIKYTSYDRVLTCLYNSPVCLNGHFFLIPLRWRIRQILLCKYFQSNHVLL